MTGKHKISLTGVLCLIILISAGAGVLQQPPVRSHPVASKESAPQHTVATPSGSTKKTAPTKVFLEAADSISFDTTINKEAQGVYGNVIFRHEGTYMYCDSAYLYRDKNILEAFSNVRMEQGDTLFVYGDYLIYEGNLALARLRDNARMENDSVTLFTDSLNYDRRRNIGYYFGGGMIVDPANELTSVYGQYLPGTKEAFFRKNVTLTNVNMVLTSDTLKYRTDTKVAVILGPSVITSDSGTIYSNRGWYNTVTEDSKLYDRSQVWSKDRSQMLTSDSLYYNRMTGYGEAFGNMFLNDTAKKVILTGNYGYFRNLEEDAMATDSARFIEYSQSDSLFLHADTLRMITIGDAQNKNREIKAYYGVRFYRFDLQGICDSMQFNTTDSVLRMYKEPVLWNEHYQMVGDTILIFFNDSTISKARIFPYAFASEQIHTDHFNQMKGKELWAYFVDKELREVYMNGNAQTIFYPMEDDGAFIGLNQTQSSYFRIFVKNRKPERMIFWPSPKGQMLPIPDLTPETKFLPGFADYNYLRPLSRNDIFLKIKKKEKTPEELRTRRRR